MSPPSKYRKKPIVIEAMQHDGSAKSGDAIRAWVGKGCDDYWSGKKSGTEVTMRIPTLEGEMKAPPGWWIIKGIKGEFYPCAPDVFEATYEPA